MCFKFADDIAAVIAAKQGRLPPCTTVVGKVELLTARVCFFALSNVEAIEGHAETIEQRRRTVGTVPDLRLCRTGRRRRVKNHPHRLHGGRAAACPHRIRSLQAGFSLDRVCEFVRSKSLWHRSDSRFCDCGYAADKEAARQPVRQAR